MRFKHTVPIRAAPDKPPITDPLLPDLTSANNNPNENTKQ